ncbi:hypothetical protein ACF0H5_016228 [Mactra antiquata]
MVVDLLTGQNYTVSPYKYLGVGYNLLYGNPDINPDPGYVLHRRIFQLTGTPPDITEAEYIKQNPCQQQQHNLLITNIDDYKNDLLALIHLSRHSNNLTSATFTKNDDYQTMQHYLQTNRAYFNITTCKYGIGTLKTGVVDNELFVGNITEDFARDVCSLPTTMVDNNKDQYYRFLDQWGTSIVLRVDIGSRTVQNIGDHNINNQTKGTTDNIRSYDIGPISFALVPITYATNWIIWDRTILQWMNIGICNNTYAVEANIAKISGNIQLVTDQYVNWTPPATTTPPSVTTFVTYAPTTPTTVATTVTSKATTTVESTTRRTTTHVPTTVFTPPVMWPYGTYGLIETAQGCPAHSVQWQVGWRLFDTEDTNPKNKYSAGIYNYLKGDFQVNDIRLFFCIRTTSRISRYDQPWPRGTYCILKYHDCPTGFAEGSIFMDNDDYNNHNTKGGTLPDGTYDENTLMKFCCRDDGSSHHPIVLPTRYSFILVRSGTMCQQVEGMYSRDLFVEWDDEDLFNSNENHGKHPYEDGGSTNTRLHFCYYRRSAVPDIIG